MRLVVGMLVLAGACRIPDEQLRVRDAAGATDTSKVADSVGDSIVGTDVGMDAITSADAVPSPCDLTAPWGDLVAVGGLGALQSVARLSPDERTAYFALDPNGQATGGQDTLFVATRVTATGTFGTAVKVTNVNDADGQSTPTISPDGMTLYYVWGQAPVHTVGTDRDLYQATRTGSVSQFGAGTKLQLSMANIEDDYPFVASDGSLWFGSKRTGDPTVSIYMAPSVGAGSFGMVMREDSLNSTSSPDTFPLVTSDLRHVFFERSPLLFTASRGASDVAFGIPVTVDEINNGGCAGTNCRPASISPDGCRLYIGTGPASGTVAMYVASKPANP